MIHQWKRALLEGASGLFERGGRKTPEIDEEQVKAETEMNLGLMRMIDKPLLETPFYGVRQPVGTLLRRCPVGRRMTGHLRNEENLINEKRIRRLMRLLGLMPIDQKPNSRCPATHACMCERGQGRKEP
ncbi:IS3 family transposase [Parasedimentitalea psychrophila]